MQSANELNCLEVRHTALYIECLLLVLDGYSFESYEVIAQYAIRSCGRLLPCAQTETRNDFSSDVVILFSQAHNVC